MVIATLNALILVLLVEDQSVANQYIDGFTMKLLIATIVTSIVWVIVALVTKPEEEQTLQKFVDIIKPGFGWNKYQFERTGMGYSILSVFVGAIGVYGALFGIGNLIYTNYGLGLLFLGLFAVSIYLIFKWWNRQ